MTWLIRSAMVDMMPPYGDFPGIAHTGIDAFLAQVRRETTFMVWLGLCLGAVIYTITPIITVYWPLPSLLLPARLRDLHAERICSTRFYLLRQAVFLLKMYACMCWGQDAKVRRKLNIAPYPEDPGTFRST